MPSTCFMERKTHRESWKGEESVKDRFTLPEAEMLNFLVGEYRVDQARKDLEKKVPPPPFPLPAGACIGVQAAGVPSCKLRLQARC